VGVVVVGVVVGVGVGGEERKGEVDGGGFTKRSLPIHLFPSDPDNRPWKPCASRCTTTRRGGRERERGPGKRERKPGKRGRKGGRRNRERKRKRGEREKDYSKRPPSKCR
jgi:hypothetical protein